MPQLPPKIPNPIITSSHPHLKMPPLSPPPPSSTTTTTTTTPGWVDEFLNFTSSRRSSHRRSVSDSIAFLEVSDSATGSFDDDHLFSMFSDDFSGGAMVAFPSPPSSERDSHRQEYPLKCGDHHNVATCDNIADCNPPQVPKVEPPEADSEFDADNPLNSDVSAASDHHPPAAGDAAVDPKRVKRILANRQSAQRSRVRKLQYISDLERSVTTLQTEVSTLSPRVAFLDHQRLILNVDNSALKQRIAALAQDKIFKDAHQEALKKEIERLRHIYHQQQQQHNLKKMGNNNNNNSAITAIPPPSSGHTIDKEQLMT